MEGLYLVSFSFAPFAPRGTLYDFSLYPLAASTRRNRFNVEFNL